jgi:hypothetical protein
VESVDPPEEEVRPLSEPVELPEEDESSEEDELPEEDELSEPVESSEDELLDEESSDGVLLDEVSVLLLVLALVPLPLAVELASACMVPIRANTPAAPASVTAAAKAAVRRAPLRTAAAAPRSSSLVAMTVPLRSDVLSRTTVGERSERSL